MILPQDKKEEKKKPEERWWGRGRQAGSLEDLGLTINEDAWRLRRGQMGSDKLIPAPGN